MTVFRFLTAGESHGPALGATLEGLPAGVPVTADGIAVDLRRRQGGYGRGARQTIEQDRAEILAGVRHGLTIGSPVLLLVRNRDWESWTRVMQVEPLSAAQSDELAVLAAEGNRRAQPVTRLRPGPRGPRRRREVRLQRCAPGARARLGTRDGGAGRGGGRLPRVPGGSSASMSGPSPPRSGASPWTRPAASRSRAESEASPLRCPDPDAEARMVARIDEARSLGNTVGGVFEVVAHGLPIGLGSHVHWDRRLDGGRWRARS